MATATLLVNATVVASLTAALGVTPRVVRRQPLPQRSFRPSRLPGPAAALAGVIALIYLNQVLCTVYILRVHNGDPSFIARHLPEGWFAMAGDNPAIRRLADHFPAPELLAPSLLRVQAFLELPFTLLAFATVVRLLDTTLYRRLARSPLPWLTSASYTTVFCVVEWDLRNPYTTDDIAIRLISAILTPMALVAMAEHDTDATQAATPPKSPETDRTPRATRTEGIEATSGPKTISRAATTSDAKEVRETTTTPAAGGLTATEGIEGHTAAPGTPVTTESTSPPKDPTETPPSPPPPTTTGRPTSTTGLLLFGVSLWALGHLILVVYDTALLYNLGHLGARLPGAAAALVVLLTTRTIATRLPPPPPAGPAVATIAHALRWGLALFLVPALAIRYGINFGTPLLAAAAGATVLLTAAGRALREIPTPHPPPLRLALPLALGATTGLAAAYAATHWTTDTFYEAALLRAAAAAMLVTVTITATTESLLTKRPTCPPPKPTDNP